LNDVRKVFFYIKKEEKHLQNIAVYELAKTSAGDHNSVIFVNRNVF